MKLKFKKKIFALILSLSLVLSFYSYSVPSAKALDGGAGWAQFFQFQIKEFGLDTLARLIARRMLSSYLNSMVDQINRSGRTGRQPSFVINWRNFLTEAQYRGEDVFRSVLVNTQVCNYFSGNLKSIFNAVNNGSIQPITQNIRVDNLDPFTKRARCTMPRGWTVANYRSNFAANGGWEALTRMSEPQNNFYGSLLMSMGELAAQRGLEAVTDQSEVIAGRGHTGTRAQCQSLGAGGLCVNGSCSNGITGPCRSNADCAVNNSQARCTFLGEVLTPGQLLGDSASNYVDKNVGWLITSDELSEVILNLIGAIIDKMTNFRKPARSPGPVETDAKYRQCVNQCKSGNTNAYATCMDRCTGTEILYSPTPTPTSGTGTPGVCSDTGTTSPRYQAQLDAALNAVFNNNPNGIADQTNTLANINIFYGYVIVELTNAGLQSTSNVLNGNGNASSGDLIAVWRNGDTLMDRYDVFTSAGSGTATIRSSFTGSQWTGQIPISSCTGSGNGGPSGITVWSDINFSGTWESFSSNDPDLSNNLVGDNSISSIQVPQGSTVELCADINYGPPCETFVGDSSPQSGDLDLQNNTIGNDTVSSIRLLSGGGSGSECSDGLDNDTDGLTDYPSDPGCLNANDNDEVTYIIVLCPDVSGGGFQVGCEAFSASNPNLTGTTIGNDNAESLNANAIQYGRLHVELCTDADYQNCTTMSGNVDDLSTVPSVGNNTVSSIIIQQL